MEVIEAIEPGRHQFLPARFEAWDTGEPLYTDKEYGRLNVLNWIAPDALYDIEAMGHSPEIKKDEVRFGSDAAEGFTGPVTSTRVDLNSYAFQVWLIRADWISAGHLISTGAYSKSRFSRVSASSQVFVSDALMDALTQRLPPGAFRARPILVSKY